MDLGVALQIVLADKALAAAVALVLAIAKMGLNVGADVLASPKHLAAVLVETCPLARGRILLTDVALDLLRSNSCVLEARIDFQIVEERMLVEGVSGKRHTVHGH